MLICSLACFHSIICASSSFVGKKGSRASIRHIEAGGIGYNQGYTTLELFLSPGPDLWAAMPFLDVRGHVFDNGKWAANLGAGIRKNYGSRVYGLNTYYDYRETKKFHYNQIGLGLETLGKVWDIRVNGYLPVGKKSSAPYSTKFDFFSGHFMFLSQKKQFAMKGVNAEGGFHFGKSCLFDFYTAAGPYYFEGKGRNAWGGKARICGMFKDYITLEISDSYDNVFHNRFQGQLTFSLPLGRKSCVKKNECQSCSLSYALNSRMVQPIGREEIVVVSSKKKEVIATDPITGMPLFFVFVDNTSSSAGTFESPYPTFALAQANSSSGNIIYVFPGDGTTTGMDSGIFLQANQKLWGSGVSHLTQTSQGLVLLPAQSNSSPTITNTNVDTEGNAITLAINNAISGFTITSALHDAIFGSNSGNLEVSSCTFENTSTFAIEASFSGNAGIAISNNQFLNNVNGIFLTLNGTSTLTCLDNTFSGQTSVSEAPVEISTNNNTLAAHFENNVFKDNITGSIRVHFSNVVDANINVLSNTITNNGTGAQSSLGSSFVVLSEGINGNCSIVLGENLFSNNTSNSLYMHTSGTFNTLAITSSANTMSNNGGSGLVLATPVDNLTLLATDNIITGINDNGIAIIASGSSSNGTVTINRNTIADIGNNSNGIAISQAFSNLDLTVLNNAISGCEGTALLCFSNEFTNMRANITGNAFNNCQNVGQANAASGVSLDTFVNLSSTITNNTFSNNGSPSVGVGLLTSGNPAVCLTLSGNNSNIDPSYSLNNPGSGIFNLSPCNVDSANVGTIQTSGTIDPVQSCSNPISCPP